MKKNLLIIFVLLIFSCNLHAAQNINNVSENLSTDEFVENTSDIPLAKYLTKISDDDLDFDSVGGSLSSISYKSKIELDKIKKFYQETLPQLGWKIKKTKDTKKLSFVRENEKLEIEFVKDGKKDVVKFFLESRS